MTEVPLPVTVVMTRRTTAERRDELISWSETLGRAARSFDGYSGHRVHARPLEDAVEVVVGLSFATSGDLVRWEQSSERRSLLEAAVHVTAGGPDPVAIDAFTSGLWTEAQASSPSLSRLAGTLIVWVALFPPALLVNFALEPYADDWPSALRTLVLTGLLVPVVVLGTVPWVTRAFLWWYGRHEVT